MWLRKGYQSKLARAVTVFVTERRVYAHATSAEEWNSLQPATSVRFESALAKIVVKHCQHRVRMMCMMCGHMRVKPVAWKVGCCGMVCSVSSKSESLLSLCILTFYDKEKRVG